MTANRMQLTKPKVFIAGCGAVSAAGRDVPALLAALKANASGLRADESFSSPRFQSNIVGAAPRNPVFASEDNPAHALAADALTQARQAAGDLKLAPGRIGLVLSTTKANIEGHEQVGLSSIGGSQVIRHWDLPDDKNKAKEALKTGKVEVLTLSPIYLPDEGIEKFASLALEHNPDIRITVQEFWLPFDLYDTTFSKRPAKVDHNAPTGEELRKLHGELEERVGLVIAQAQVGEARRQGDAQSVIHPVLGSPFGLA